MARAADAPERSTVPELAPTSVSEYAKQALDLACSDHTEQAGALVTQMVEEHGPGSLADVAYEWVESALKAVGVTNRGRIRRLAVASTPDRRTVETVDVDTLSPPVRWATRYYYAQANNDIELAADLWGSLRSNRQVVECLFGVLHVCASTVRNAGLLRGKRG